MYWYNYWRITYMLFKVSINTFQLQRKLLTSVSTVNINSFWYKKIKLIFNLMESCEVYHNSFQKSIWSNKNRNMLFISYLDHTCRVYCKLHHYRFSHPRCRHSLQTLLQNDHSADRALSWSVWLGQVLTSISMTLQWKNTLLQFCTSILFYT